MTTEHKTKLAGYREDAVGRQVPESLIPPIDLLRDALVRDMVAKAKTMNTTLSAFKTGAFSDVYAFIDLSMERYGVTPRGTRGKGNLTLYSFDGAFKVQIAVAEHISFDERLQAAKELIDECINLWAASSTDEIKVLVQDAFHVDQAGKINVGRVLGLRRLDIQDAKWQKAMQAIGESVQVVGSKSYVRFYERVSGTTDQYTPISLDMAAL